MNIFLILVVVQCTPPACARAVSGGAFAIDPGVLVRRASA
jgi:hypothetical protein